jgi:hypothetical protein
VQRHSNRESDDPYEDRNAQGLGDSRERQGAKERELTRMKKHIFIALDNIDRAEHLMPYLEDIAGSDTKFEIFIRTKASNWSWLQARLAALEVNTSGAVQFCQNAWCDQIERERHAAESKLKAMKQAVLGKSADIQVRIYSGSLKRALKEFVRHHQGSQIVMPMTVSRTPTGFLRRHCAAWHSATNEIFFAIVLAYPNRSAG